MTTISSDQPVCPQCGASIPPEAPQGLCPKCVMSGVATEAGLGVPHLAAADVPPLDRVARAFPNLEVVELIGRGGMGFVYKARQPHLDRFVALKLLPDRLARDPQFAERFTREGRVLARLNHPSIVSVYDFGRTADFYFLMMEYVEGVNLRQAMRAGRFSPREALAVVPEICEALQYAHDQGILHRDIKPENILLDTQGRVKIADFGIAKLVGDDPMGPVTLTNTGAALGTPHYMAPEQLEKPSEVDHRADIYSLGVVLYEMLTGELPIGRFEAPSSKTPVGREIDAVVFRALEKNRERRQRSAAEFKTQVNSASEFGIGAPPASASPASPPDFLLCHPALPRMAQALSVYALVVAPLFWLLGLVTIEPPRDTNALVQFVDSLTGLITVPGSLLGIVLLFLGGLQLRALRASAWPLLVLGILTNLVMVLLMTAGTLWADSLVSEMPDVKVSPVEASVAVAAFGAVIFEVLSLIWLFRHRAQLLERLARHGTARRAGVPPRRPAILSAALTAAGLVLIVGPVSLSLVDGRGPGLMEFLLVIVLGIITGLGGCVMGWSLLLEMRRAGHPSPGLRLALFGALAGPVVLFLSMDGAALIYLLRGGTPGLAVTLAVAAGFALAAFLVTGLIPAIGRWAQGLPRSRHWSTRRLGMVTAVAALLGLAVALLQPRAVRSGPTAVQDQLDRIRQHERLPAGTVELVALSTHPSSESWWRPDGLRLNNRAVTFPNPGHEVRPSRDQNAVEMIFRIPDSPGPDASLRFLLPDSPGWSGGSLVPGSGPETGDTSLVAALFPRALHTTTVLVGLAAGPWETLAETSPAGQSSTSLAWNDLPIHVEFLGAVEDRHGNVVVTVAHNVEDHDVRVVAVDTQGRETASLTETDRTRYLVARFPGRPPGDIQAYRLQVRPFRWAVFNEVALQPRAGITNAATWHPSGARRPPGERAPDWNQEPVRLGLPCHPGAQPAGPPWQTGAGILNDPEHRQGAA